MYQVDYAAEDDAGLILPCLPRPAHQRMLFVLLTWSAIPIFSPTWTRDFPIPCGWLPLKAKPAMMRVPKLFFCRPLQIFQAWKNRSASRKRHGTNCPNTTTLGLQFSKSAPTHLCARRIALEFPMRNPNLLYFPTLHIRNGEAAEEANFDLDLFCQARAGWLRTYDVASSFMDMDKAKGVLDPGERVLHA